MALGDYVKGVPKPKTSYSSLVNSPAKSSGTPFIAPKPYVPPAPVARPIAPIQMLQNTRPYTGPASLQNGQITTGALPSGGGGGGMASAASAPAAPPAPPKPPIDYSTYSEEQLAGVDSAFGEQRQMFKTALDKFLLEDTRQRGDVNRDKDVALEGIGRNETSGLTSLNEDFAARGLGKSGLRLGAVKEATDQYGRQRTNVRDGHTKSIGDLNARKEKMNSDTTNSIAASRREAYARLAAKQELT